MKQNLRNENNLKKKKTKNNNNNNKKPNNKWEESESDVRILHFTHELACIE